MSEIPEHIKKAAERWGGINRNPDDGLETKSKNFCSFCGKPENDVEVLVSGPKVFICDECVETAVDVIAEQKQQSMDSRG